MTATSTVPADTPVAVTLLPATDTVSTELSDDVAV